MRKKAKGRASCPRYNEPEQSQSSAGFAKDDIGQLPQECPDGAAHLRSVVDLDAIAMTGPQYLPAEYVEHKRSYVRYSVRMPDGSTKQWRVYFDRIRDVTHRRAQARETCRVINDRLRAGWRPWLDSPVYRTHEAVVKVIRAMYDVKAKELRPDSLRNYRARVEVFAKWCSANAFDVLPCAEFSAVHAQAFMDHVSEGISAKTFNNYLIDFRALCAAACKRGYMTDNPFKSVTMRRPQQAAHRAPTAEECAMLIDWCRRYDLPMLVCIGLVYHCALRPAEICRLLIRDVDLQRGTITVHADNAKSGRARHVTIPAHFVPLLKGHITGNNRDTSVNWSGKYEITRKGKRNKEMEIGNEREGNDDIPCFFSPALKKNGQLFFFKKPVKPEKTQENPLVAPAPPLFHLVGHGGVPHRDRQWPTRMAERFAAIRTIVGLPEHVQLYGFKDLAAMRMLEAGFTPADVRDHFDHSSLDITDKYLKRRIGVVNSGIRDRFPAL